MKCLKSDGKWRIMAFLGDLSIPENGNKLNAVSWIMFK